MTRQTALRIALLSLVTLPMAACGAAYHIEQQCRDEAGPEPGYLLHGFGLVGAMIQESQPDWAAWDARRAACVTRYSENGAPK